MRCYFLLIILTKVKKFFNITPLAGYRGIGTPIMWECKVKLVVIDVANLAT